MVTRRLDDVLGDRTAAVVKIDVEGFEAVVLRGASRALAEKRLRSIVFEETCRLFTAEDHPGR